MTAQLNGVLDTSYYVPLEPLGDYLLVSPATEWIGAKGRQWIRQDVHRSLIEIAQQFRAETGRALTVLECFRTYATQVEYKRRQNNGTGNPAAYPGTSNHGLGVACDFGSNVDSWTSAEHLALERIGRPYGLRFPLRGNGQPNEPWHGEIDPLLATTAPASSGAVPYPNPTDPIYEQDPDMLNIIELKSTEGAYAFIGDLTHQFDNLAQRAGIRDVLASDELKGVVTITTKTDVTPAVFDQLVRASSAGALKNGETASALASISGRIGQPFTVGGTPVTIYGALASIKSTVESVLGRIGKPRTANGVDQTVNDSLSTIVAK